MEMRMLVEESWPRADDLSTYGLKFKKKSNGGYIRVKGCLSEVEQIFLNNDFGNIRQAFLSIFRPLPVRIVTGYLL
jgi:hypothetical protein